ncbi:hypothetical protein [Chroococcidiopsis sp.]|uniref:hypothetical protein n=1 Tax=Chroococcidiopsis sp. TaxID=3088168 RepID=UPI003F3620B4
MRLSANLAPGDSFARSTLCNEYGLVAIADVVESHIKPGKASTIVRYWSYLIFHSSLQFILTFLGLPQQQGISGTKGDRT